MLAHDDRALTRNPSSTERAGGRGQVLGGIAAQGSQALSSFVLQVSAARLLGLEGLGMFAALFGFIVLATALSSGFIGDSLAVLDRSQREIRAALQAWLVIILLTVGVSYGLLSWSIGFLPWSAALAFAGAAIVFLAEDALRRLLMASLRFWHIVAVDLSGLLASLVVLVLMAQLVSGVTLTHLLVALLVGQLVAGAVALSLLPVIERRLLSVRGAAMRTVAAYGSWRALQHAVRPALLGVVRVFCLTAVTTSAVGGLEAARVYMAPSMLALGGVSSFLFATYAVRSDSSLTELMRLADRSVAGLLVGIGGFGIVALGLMPWLGPALTGGRYPLSVTAVAGWAAYTASVAAVTPYGQLAAVRGRPASVLAWRIADSVVSLLVVIVVVRTQRSVIWVPFALAAGSLLGGVAIRQFVLRAEVDG